MQFELTEVGNKTKSVYTMTVWQQYRRWVLDKLKTGAFGVSHKGFQSCTQNSYIGTTVRVLHCGCDD